MSDFSLELQQAIVAALKADAALVALVTGIYYQPPHGAVKPYVSLGPEDWVSDDADCIQGYEGAVQIDVWSATVGKPEAKRIANAVQDVLHGAELALDDTCAGAARAPHHPLLH